MGGGVGGSRDGKEETTYTNNPLLKNLRGRWQPHYSDSQLKRLP